MSYSYTDGKTSMEKTALFNNCLFISVSRTDDGSWCVYKDTKDSGHGFSVEAFCTRKAALAFAHKEFPQLHISVQRGNKWTTEQALSQHLAG